MCYSIREEFYDVLIRRALEHGVKTRLVRITRQGLVQTKGNPRWDICPQLWTTVGTEAEWIARIEAMAELEGKQPLEFRGSRRHRSPLMRGIFAQPVGRTGTV